FSAQLKVYSLCNPEPLDDAQIIASKARSIEHQVIRSTLASVGFGARGIAGGPDVTSRGYALITVTSRRCLAHNVGENRIRNDVLRQVVGDLTSIVETHFQFLLQLVSSHTDEVYVPKVI